MSLTTNPRSKSPSRDSVCASYLAALGATRPPELPRRSSKLMKLSPRPAQLAKA